MACQELGKAEHTVSRWCSNKVQPSLENLVEIARVLDIEVRMHITQYKNNSIQATYYG